MTGIALLGTIAALVMTVVIVQRTVGDELRQAYLEQSRTTASTIAGASMDAVITEDRPLLQTIAEQVIERDPRIGSIAIENESGTALAVAGNASSGERLLTFEERLEYGGEDFGRVTIEWSTAEFYGAIDHAARLVAIQGGLMLLGLAAVLVFGVHRLVVAPLTCIERFLRSVHAGEPATDLPEQRSPELQYLADQASSIAELVETEQHLRSEATDNAERLRLLLNEVDHRVKNNLAAIVGLVQRGTLSADTSRELAQGLLDRIMSMSRTHEALAGAEWSGVSLTEDLPRILEANGNGEQPPQIRFDGPDVTIPPNEATPLCMALSELVMNARKHGALSVDGGHVDLQWRRQKGGLRFDWTELGGPAPLLDHDDDGVGAGLVLVRGLVEYQLGGTVEIDFRTEGFAASLDVPIGAD